MDRRSALKSLGIASGIAFVPFGLLSQPNDEPLIISHQSGATWSPVHKFGHNPSVNDKIYDIEIIYDGHSEKSKHLKS